MKKKTFAQYHYPRILSLFPRLLKYTIKWVKKPKQTPCPQWNSTGSCPLIILAAPTCKTQNLSCGVDALFRRAARDTQASVVRSHLTLGGEARKRLRWRKMSGEKESDGGGGGRRREEVGGDWIGRRVLMGNERETRWKTKERGEIKWQMQSALGGSSWGKPQEEGEGPDVVDRQQEVCVRPWAAHNSNTLKAFSPHN